MNSINRFLLFICLFTTITSVTKAQGWRGFVPLHSTRAEVERVIGPPMKPNGATYDLPDERVTVLYSDSSCIKGWPHGWNVPFGTVVGIIVYPKTKKTITDLGIDLSKYKKALNVSGDMIVHDSATEGISIGTDLKGEIIVIQYNPASKDRHLMCPEAADRQAKIDKGESTYLKPFVSYFDISREEERGNLDALVYKLNESPAGSKVYIIGYGGRQACPNEALIRANRVKNYLIKKHRINAQRITTIDGGYSDTARIDLHIVSLGEPEPLSYPNIYPGKVRLIKKGCINLKGRI